MAAERLSRLQRRILAWLLAEDQRLRGTSLRNLAAKGLVTLARTPGGKVQAIDLTAAGRAQAEVLNKGQAATVGGGR